jgi:hypothetical protein
MSLSSNLPPVFVNPAGAVNGYDFGRFTVYIDEDPNQVEPSFDPQARLQHITALSHRESLLRSVKNMADLL